LEVGRIGAFARTDRQETQVREGTGKDKKVTTRGKKKTITVRVIITRAKQNIEGAAPSRAHFNRG